MGQVAMPQPPLHIRPRTPRFVEERHSDGLRYRAAPQSLVLPVKGALVGWKVRSGADADTIDMDVTETAELTPYNESTGPRDPGDGFRWVEKRIVQGRGIVVVPPAGWTPADDLMRMTTGTVSLMATENASDMLAVAGADVPGTGFVLSEPAQGWSAEQPPSPGPGAKSASWKWLLPAGALVAVGALAYVGLRRR